MFLLRRPLPMLSSRPVVSRRASTLLIALAAASPWAPAQTAAKPGAAAAAAPLAWPTKPLKIIVGFPAGSSPDLTARTFSEPLSKALGQPALVENKVGAGGDISAVGVPSPGRSPLAPDVPGLVEAGISNFNLEIWNALGAPATLPKPIQAKLAALISEIARSEEVRGKLFQQGWQTVGSSPEGLANRVKADTNLLGGVIAMRGIKAE